MFTVTRTDVRPNMETPFFSTQVHGIKQLMSENNITRSASLSQDGLTMTTAIECPSRDTWLVLVSNEAFDTSYIQAMKAYNAMNGIISTYETA